MSNSGGSKYPRYPFLNLNSKDKRSYTLVLLDSPRHNVVTKFGPKTFMSATLVDTTDPNPKGSLDKKERVIKIGENVTLSIGHKALVSQLQQLNPAPNMGDQITIESLGKVEGKNGFSYYNYQVRNEGPTGKAPPQASSGPTFQ